MHWRSAFNVPQEFPLKKTCMRDDGWDDAPFLVTNACAQLEDWQVHGYQDDADEYTYEHNH